MSVGAPINTSLIARDGASPVNLAMTCDAGHADTALLVWCAWLDAAGAGSITTVVWDTAGVNEALASVAAKVDLNGNTWHVQFFYKLNPTPGATKTIDIAWANSTDMSVGALFFENVHQSASFGAIASDAAVTVVVASAAGDTTVSVALSSNTVTSTNQTIIDVEPGAAIATGMDYALAAGSSVTHTWNSTSTVATVGVAVKQVTAGGPDLSVGHIGEATIGGSVF